jgi:hypothetical protein
MWPPVPAQKLDKPLSRTQAKRRPRRSIGCRSAPMTAPCLSYRRDRTAALHEPQGCRHFQPRLHISLAMTWKKTGKAPPIGGFLCQASILALIVCPPSAVCTIPPFSGALALRSEKRSRDPSRRVIVISHVAIRAMLRGSFQRDYAELLPLGLSFRMTKGPLVFSAGGPLRAVVCPNSR